MSAGQRSRSSKESQDESTQSGGGESGGGGSYTTDFPDSTKSTALLSPPDPALNPLFAFDPAMNYEFSDWSEREFLLPTLHVEGKSSGTKEKQDVYERIEERLRAYRTEAEKRSRNGMEQGKGKGMEQGKKGTRRESENPFSKETTETDGLSKRSMSNF